MQAVSRLTYEAFGAGMATDWPRKVTIDLGVTANDLMASFSR
jgi:hypothetical protein